MGRKSIEVVCDDQFGRDKGKTFIVTEMSAWDAETWGARAFGIMARAGLKAPDGEVLQGMAAVAVYGVSSLLSAPWAEVRPLLDEMIDRCVKIKEEAIPVGRAITRDDIEEPETILRLREEALKLHTGFSVAAGLLSAVVQATGWLETRGATPAPSAPIPTSPPPSERCFPRDMRPLTPFSRSIRSPTFTRC